MRKTLCSLVASAGLLAAATVCAAPGDVVLGVSQGFMGGNGALAHQAGLPSVHGLAAGSNYYRLAPDTRAADTHAVAHSPADEQDSGPMFVAGAILIVALIVKRISG